LSTIAVMFVLTAVTPIANVACTPWNVAVTVAEPAALPISRVDDVDSTLVSLDWYELCDVTVCVVLSVSVAIVFAVARWK
jgi:hypothetical protein